MSARIFAAALFSVSITGGFLCLPNQARAEIATLYAQSDASGEMVSQQATFQNTWISSESLGNLILGKDSLSVTFTMKDPNASNMYGQPGGFALSTCATHQNLQTYYFTAADRTLLADGAFHTFNVETGTTTLGVADGETPICATFFNLSQYHNSTHLKSNAAGTIPYLIIEGTPPPPPVIPLAPEGAVTVYEQSDKTGIMTNTQQTYLNSFIDSASLGNLPLGQGKLYLTFIMKDPNASNVYGTPQGMCLQPAGVENCNSRLQTYYFTAEDRAMLADQAFHTFMVETGTTTSMYADGTQPVSVGFFGLSQYQYGTKIKGNASATIPYLIIQTAAPPDPCFNGACISNVLFLPGIEASRLYYRGALGIEHQVWEPDYRTDVTYLALNGDGTSKYPLYTKDIVDTVQAHNPLIGTIADMFGSNLETYAGFVRFMDALVASSTVKEWRAYPYDWRYDVRDIVENGTPTETPDGSIKQIYLTDMLRDMASSSPTKKVTIVAHSNGGLLAKALAIRLGTDASKYIDRIIMIGTPQWGTPSDIGTMLHGDGQTNGLGLITDSGDIRAAAETMPSAYGLLPSPAYFTRIADPVVTFDPTGLLSGTYAASFGEALTSFSALASFLADAAGLNAEAGSPSDLRTPLALSSALVDKAAATHSILDSWTPPPGITVTSIAGWGQDTVKTLAYTTKQRISCNTSASTFLCAETPYLEHVPVTTQDGDGTVVSPSAVGDLSQGLYFDSFLFEKNEKIKIIHQNLTSSTVLQKVLLNLFTQKDSIMEPYISINSPSNGTNPVKLRISSHSPVNTVVTDANGKQSGVLPIPGTEFAGVKRDIPGSSVQVFDDEEYISVPVDGTYQVLASGYATGSATIDVETVNGDIVGTTATFTSVPTTASSTLSFSVTSGTPTVPVVDVNGDGTTDFSAVSSSAGSDPLAYARYMRAAIGAFRLPKNKNQLDRKIGEIERQLASAKKGGTKSDLSLLTTLAHYVEQQVTLKNPEKGIPVAQAEIILGMINTLKTLLI